MSYDDALLILRRADVRWFKLAGVWTVGLWPEAARRLEVQQALEVAFADEFGCQYVLLTDPCVPQKYRRRLQYRERSGYLPGDRGKKWERWIASLPREAFLPGYEGKDVV